VDPQGEFVYAEDSSRGSIVPLKLDATTGSLTPGNEITGVFAGGANGGVGDPFSFAVSGTSLVWQDNCTVLVDNAFVFDGCWGGAIFGAGPGTGGGNTGPGGTPPPPAATFTLSVVVSNGGGVISSPAGIDVNPAGLNEGFVAHGFPNGTGVGLTATPPDTATSYDITWSGACGGDGATSGVLMTQDQTCYVSFTPSSLR
jgi:hypothetical protein